MDRVSIAKEKIGKLSSGDLHFKCAAHGLVGSSEFIFRNLSCIVVSLLHLNALPPEQELETFFEL
jgi:hypothetical protein